MPTYQKGTLYPLRNMIAPSWSVYLDGVSIAASTTLNLDPIIIDFLNCSFSTVNIAMQPCIGWEECYGIHAAGAAAQYNINRQFSLNGSTWYTIVTELKPAAGAVSELTLNMNLRRYPAVPYFRYQFVNNDAVLALVLTGTITLRAA